MINKVKGEFYFLQHNSPGLKPNFSKLSKEVGISRQTLSKMWKDPTGSERPRQKKASQFDPYFEEIRDKFISGSYSVKSVFKYFQLKYPDTVFKSYDSFKGYVRSNKLSELRQESAKAHLRFETLKGQQVQFDWKENLSITLKNGQIIHFNIFTAVYGYSRYVELVYSPTKTTVDVLRCMITILKRAGGKPAEFYTDNMSAIVSCRGGTRTKQSEIVQFEKDTGIPIKLAKPRSPQSKGKVESANRFIDWLKPYDGELESEEELIQVIAELNREINLESSRTTHQIRSVLMKKEKEYLRPLPTIPVLDSYIKDAKKQKVPTTLLVDYKGRGYSVPKKYINKYVKLVPAGDELQIYYNENLICVHELSEKAFNYKPEHYEEGLRSSLGKSVDSETIRQRTKENLARLSTIGRDKSEEKK